MGPTSDASYKHLFSHPEIARELLQAASPAAWAKQAQPSDFEHINASYVSEHGQQRHGDMVWRIRRKCKPSIYMLIEFQSTPDRHMPLRMLSYAALLCEDLAKQRKPPDHRTQLLLPIVIYSGVPPWSVPCSVASTRTIAPPEIAQLQPELNYRLIDRNIGPGVIQSLLRLEHGNMIDFKPKELCATLTQWLANLGNDDLDSAVAKWAGARLSAQFTQMIFPEGCNMAQVSKILDENINTLEELYVCQARHEGRQKGRQEGRQEGRCEGQLEERRNTLRILFERTGMPLDTEVTAKVAAADAEQLLAWVNSLIDGKVPPELMSAGSTA